MIDKSRLLPHVLAAPTLALLPVVCHAQFAGNPYVTLQYEHDSNVFRVPNSQVAQQFNGDPTLSDSDRRYLAGAYATYLWGRQKFSGQVEARRIDYDHFSYLNHSEYMGNLAMDWKILKSFDGTLDFRQERLAAAFAQLDSKSTLTVNQDRMLGGTANYLVNPNWRISTGINFHTLKTPLQLYPDYTLHETVTQAGIDYLGVANLTYGVSAVRTAGNYSHAPGTGPYSQTTTQFNAVYKITGLSSLNGALGYTTRNQTQPAGNVSAITGTLGLVRQLTGKTSVYLQLSRAVNSYVAAGGSEIDSTAAAGVNWSATYKLLVALGYSYTKSTFIGQPIPGTLAGAPPQGRSDHYPAGQLNLTYQLFRHIDLKGYYTRQSRESNYELARFHDTTYGASITAHWK